MTRSRAAWGSTEQRLLSSSAKGRQRQMSSSFKSQPQTLSLNNPNRGATHGHRILRLVTAVNQLNANA
ncbi:hypothetical protein E4U57_006775 [Claviceps arundinis]|uniref:Uncharacterized protein n=1 Tax=Claviceps arundinis TaxID=1623583 RepID=A0A9P7MWC4_9HYPO|nr:hypothetical protein E4U57_006775 [Claviceps arundinis]KAG5970664.1 hypothetical protein E4U56_007451 [Claviceps arundinis]